jgi:molecular chaperone GrpE
MKKEKNKPENTEEVKETAVEETKEEQLQKALDEKNDQFLRLYAEYDNFRKRSQKEKQDIYSSSRADVIKDLLPIMDNFDRAANNSEGNYEDYKKGIDLIFNQFVEILTKNGVEAYGARGDEFDPNIHNAVMTVEDADLGENQIASVFSKGYKLGDKIIREAVVTVANS